MTPYLEYSTCTMSCPGEQELLRWVTASRAGEQGAEREYKQWQLEALRAAPLAVCEGAAYIFDLTGAMSSMTASSPSITWLASIDRPCALNAVSALSLTSSEPA